MPHVHTIGTVTTHSEYFGQKDPITRQSFRPGDKIVICKETHTAFLLENYNSFTNDWGGRCPFCKETIHFDTQTQKARPSSTPTRSHGSQLSATTLGVVFSLFVVVALICFIGIGLLFQNVIVQSFQTPSSENVNNPIAVVSPNYTEPFTPVHEPASTRTAIPAQEVRPTETVTPTETSIQNGVSCGITVTGRYARLWVQYQSDLGCPFSSTEQGVQDAEQKFEHGHMFWRADIDRYYVVYDGGGITYGAWASYSRTMGAIQNCPEEPPAGLRKPISGFGDIWCVLGGANSPTGWAVDQEYGFVPKQGISVQDFEHGVIFQDSDGAPDQKNLVYVLTGTGFYRVSP